MGGNGAQYAGGKKLYKKKLYEQRVEKRYLVEQRRQAELAVAPTPKVLIVEDEDDISENV